MVDEDTGQLVADGTLDEGCGNGRVHAAGEAADNPGIADLLADAVHLLLKDVARGPVRFQLGALEEEVFQHLLAVGGVLHLGVPLHAVQALLLVGECGNFRARRGGQHLEALGSLVDGVTVAHPGVLVLGHSVQDGTAFAQDGGLGGAVLPQAGLVHLAAEGVGHGLEAVADAEDRDAGLEKVGADARGAVRVNAGGAAGEDDGGWVLGQELLSAVGMRNHFRIHIRFPDAAGNQLRVLGTVVNNQHRLLGSLGCSGSSHRTSLLCALAPTHLERACCDARNADQ